MPLYDYRCQECSTEFEIRLPMSDYELPLQQPCPNCSTKGAVTQIIGAPPLLDPYKLGISKPPSDFRKYVLGRMKASVPGNKIGQGRFGDIPKEI